MKKKIIISGIIAILLFFTTSYCYASQNNKTDDNNTINLGDQITESMDKTQKSAENLTNKVTNNNMVNGIKNVVNDGEEAMDNMINRSYNVVRTNANDGIVTNTQFSDVTWIWIVLAVVGIIIFAAVWVYAMQNSGRD